MFNGFRRFLPPPVFPQNEEKSRAAELLNIVLIALSFLSFIALIALILGHSRRYQIYIVVALFALVLPILQVPMRRGYVRQVGYLTIFIFTGGLTFAILNGGTIRAPEVSLFSLIVIISGLIISRRAMYWTATINAIIFLTIMWLEINGQLPEPIGAANIQQGIIFTGNLIMAAILLSLALRRIYESLERARQGEEKLSVLNTELEQRVMERTAELAERDEQIKKRASQLEAVANTARSAATVHNPEQLLYTITRDISSRFGFYHVGIFLMDDKKEFAILRAANSQGGQEMLARGHRLKVGEQGIVGNVTYSGIPRIALDVGEDAVYFDNPNLPETHSEVALPLKFGKEIIGALDIQSKEFNAFTRDDLEIFSILADQVSVAIQNARSFEQVQSALKEVEFATSQLTGMAWKGYTKEIRTKGYLYDGIRPEPLIEPPKSGEDKGGLSIPVQVRGNTIGNLKLRTADQARKWTDDELAIIESTAERVAIALEGARLLEDAQKRAIRETFLSELATKLSTSFQLESILRDTVEELGQTLKDSKVTFQLVNPSSPMSVENDNGSSKRSE